MVHPELPVFWDWGSYVPPSQKHPHIFRLVQASQFGLFFSAITWETGYVDIWGLMSDLFYEKIDLILIALNYDLKFFSVSFHCLFSLATLSVWKKIYILSCMLQCLPQYAFWSERTCIFIIFNTVWIHTYMILFLLTHHIIHNLYMCIYKGLNGNRTDTNISCIIRRSKLIL